MGTADPNSVAVLLEDSAAVTSVVLSFAFYELAHWSGNVMYDAFGSISVGVLLGATASFLIRRNVEALSERSIPNRRLQQILAVIEKDPIITSIHDVKAIALGPDAIRFKAEINVNGAVVTKRYIQEKVNLEHELERVQAFRTPEELESYLVSHGSQVVDSLGKEIDRIEMTMTVRIIQNGS